MASIFPEVVRSLGQTGLARRLGVRQQQVWNWLNRDGGHPPVERCPSIEREFNGSLTCEQLRPDVRWLRVPDPAWPHPDGRPCIDFAPPERPAKGRARAKRSAA